MQIMTFWMQAYKNVMALHGTFVVKWKYYSLT